ncbi:MAG: hypothetical protein HUJ98_14590 [Bacteroidaceae bacterium]|nr:hypothetical protein [Bacteroidaceae bacterium]
MGDFIEKLKRLPIWEDLLVVIMPDHSVIQRTTFENPEFFHIPVLWVGGAVREPRRIHTLMNQSDVAVTLLSQMNVPHPDYPWSRNVLSKNYTYPFAYSTFSSGILFADSTGVSIYDLNSNQEIVSQPSPSLDRIQKAKAILQASYDDLDGLGSPH